MCGTKILGKSVANIAMVFSEALFFYKVLGIREA